MLTKTRGQTSKLGYFVKSSAYSNIIVLVVDNTLWIEQSSDMISVRISASEDMVLAVLACASPDEPYDEVSRFVPKSGVTVDGFGDGCIIISQGNDTVMLSCEDVPVLVEAIRRTVAA